MKYIESFYKDKFIIGILLVLLGIVLPSFLTVESFNILGKLKQSIAFNDSLLLFSAGGYLLFLNSVRAFPHYIGAFFISESIKMKKDFRYGKFVKPLIVVVIIPIVYRLIYLIHHISYHIGIPALTMIVLVAMLGKRNYNYVSWWKKVALITVFVTAMQSLDIMPLLNSLPIGKGDVSTSVKLTAQYLKMENVFDISIAILFSFLSVIGLIFFMLIKEENQLRAMNELQEKNMQILKELNLGKLQNRTHLEMRQLAHDINSPLTSAQALVSLLKMNLESQNLDKEAHYLESVENSLEKIGEMVMETLDTKHKSVVTTEELMDTVLANISIMEYSNIVTLNNPYPDDKIFVNKIYLARAIINLIENSYHAMYQSTKIIIISVERKISKENEQICISVTDNGTGIKENIKQKIWQNGFTTKNSHGLGMSFIKNVVDDLGGNIKLESKVGEGTRVSIFLERIVEDE